MTSLSDVMTSFRIGFARIFPTVCLPKISIFAKIFRMEIDLKMVISAKKMTFSTKNKVLLDET